MSQLQSISHESQKRPYVRLAWALFIGILGIAAINIVAILGFIFLNNLDDVFLQQYAIQGVFGSVIILIFASIGLLIIRRYPAHGVGWILMAIALAFLWWGLVTPIGNIHQQIGFPPPFHNLGTFALWASPWAYLPALFIPLMFIPLYFPTGRLLSPRWRWVPLAGSLSLVLTILAYMLSPGDGEYVNPFPITGSEVLLPIVTTVGTWAGGFGFLGTLISLIVRYLRADNLERKQMKWLFYPLCVILVIYNLPALTFLPSLSPELLALWDNIGFALFFLTPIIVGIAIGIAILRHQLFDIDVIIRRTLVYSVVSLLLVLIYFGIVITAQNFLSGFIPEDNTLLIVASTLAVAALFNPVLRRVQAVIDRLFYRKRYDATQILDQFTSEIRDAVEPEVLQESLLTTVNKTIQPETISLWIATKQ